MNPYTKSLLDQLQDPSLAAWLADWDSLEALIIDVYRRGGVEAVDQSEFAALKQRLDGSYPLFKNGLKSHWQDLRAGGQPLERDPFLSLLSAEGVEAFVENWASMQLLPAAREAINRYLHQRLQAQG